MNAKKLKKVKNRRDFVQSWIVLLRIMQTGKTTTREIAEALAVYGAELKVGHTTSNVICILKGLETLELVSCRKEVVKLQSGGSSEFFYWMLTCQGEEVLGNIQAIFAGKYNPQPCYKVGVELPGSARLLHGIGRMVILATLDHLSMCGTQIRQVLAQVCAEIASDEELRRGYLKPLKELGYLDTTHGKASLTEAGKQRASFLRCALGMDDEECCDFKWMVLDELFSQQKVQFEKPVEQAPKLQMQRIVEQVVKKVEPKRPPKFTPTQLLFAAANYTAMGLLQPLLLLLVAGRGSSLVVFAEKTYPRANDSFGKIRENVEVLMGKGYIDEQFQLTSSGLRLLDLVSLVIAPQLVAVGEITKLDDSLLRVIRRLAIIKVIDIGHSEKTASQVIAALFECAEERDKAQQTINRMLDEDGRSWLTKEPVAVSLIGNGILKFLRNLLPVEYIACDALRNLEVINLAEQTTAVMHDESSVEQENRGKDEFWSDPRESTQELTAADVANSFLSI